MKQITVEISESEVVVPRAWLKQLLEKRKAVKNTIDFRVELNSLLLHIASAEQLLTTPK